MNTNNPFQDRLWIAVQIQHRRSKQITRAGIGVLAVGAVMAGILLPNRASAWPQVVEQLNDFKSVQWTQHDEGIIVNIGKADTQRVPFFRKTESHYVSIDPPQISKSSAKREWLNMQKSRDGAVSFGTKQSSGLGLEDIKMAVNHFDSIASFRSATREYIATYGGKSVKAFDLQHTDSQRTVKVTCYAEVNSNRLAYLNFQILGPEKELLYTRTIFDIRYDRPIARD